MMRNNETKQVFVAYPYKIYDKKAYRSAYERAGKEYGVTFFFADERITNMHILAKIRRQIEIADFSIFDISGWNPNVSLELGMAYVLPDVSWYICYNPTHNAHQDVPSDIRGIDRIQYTDISELKEKLVILLDQNYPRPKVESLQDHESNMGERVLSLLRDSEDKLSMQQIAASLELSADMTTVVIKGLIKSGKIKSAGTGKGTRYFIKR